MARPRKDENETERVNFSNLTLARVQELVGRAADFVEVHNKWVVLTFSGAFSANTRVWFRHW